MYRALFPNFILHRCEGEKIMFSSVRLFVLCFVQDFGSLNGICGLTTRYFVYIQGSHLLISVLSNNHAHEIPVIFQNHQRYEKLICFHFLHCYHQRKIRWLERDLNSHLRVSRPPLYPLRYRVNEDWWRVLSN